MAAVGESRMVRQGMGKAIGIRARGEPRYQCRQRFASNSRLPTDQCLMVNAGTKRGDEKVRGKGLMEEGREAREERFAWDRIVAEGEQVV